MEPCTRSDDALRFAASIEDGEETERFPRFALKWRKDLPEKRAVDMTGTHHHLLAALKGKVKKQPKRVEFGRIEYMRLHVPDVQPGAFVRIDDATWTVETPFEPAVVINQRERRTLGRTAFFVALCGFTAGIILVLVVQGATSAVPFPPPPSPPVPPAANRCETSRANASSTLVESIFLSTFFNGSCIAAGGTGDPCDAQIAEQYAVMMFSSLRIEQLCSQFVSFCVLFGLAQLGGIPRVTDPLGAFFWMAWTVTQAAQLAVTFTSILLSIFSFLGVRNQLRPCLVTVDGLPLLDFYTWATFAAQPPVMIKLAMVFAYVFLLNLAFLVLDGSLRRGSVTAESKRPSKGPEALNGHGGTVELGLPAKPQEQRSCSYYSERETPPTDEEVGPLPASTSGDRGWILPPLVDEDKGPPRAPMAKRRPSTCRDWLRRLAPDWLRRLVLQTVPRDEFVADATGAKKPQDKIFRSRIPLIRPFPLFHLARCLLFAVSLSVLATFTGVNGIVPSVSIAWALAAFATIALPITTSYLQGINRSVPAFALLSPLFFPLLFTLPLLPLAALFLGFVWALYSLGSLILKHTKETNGGWVPSSRDEVSSAQLSSSRSKRYKRYQTMLGLLTDEVRALSNERLALKSRQVAKKRRRREPKKEAEDENQDEDLHQMKTDMKTDGLRWVYVGEQAGGHVQRAQRNGWVLDNDKLACALGSGRLEFDKEDIFDKFTGTKARPRPQGGGALKIGEEENRTVELKDLHSGHVILADGHYYRPEALSLTALETRYVVMKVNFKAWLMLVSTQAMASQCELDKARREQTTMKVSCISTYFSRWTTRQFKKIRIFRQLDKHLSGPLRIGFGWLASVALFSPVNSVLARTQSEYLAFTNTSFATLAGGLVCFWALIAIAPCISYHAWAQAWRLTNETLLAESFWQGGEVLAAGYLGNTSVGKDFVDAAMAPGLDESSGFSGWIWAGTSPLTWIFSTLAVLLLVDSFVSSFVSDDAVMHSTRAGSFCQLWHEVKDIACKNRLLVKAVNSWIIWALQPLSHLTRRFGLLGPVILFTAIAVWSALEKEKVAIAYANSFQSFSTLRFRWDGLLPSIDRLLELLEDPQAVLNDLYERITKVVTQVNFDPIYFAESVEVLNAINLCLSFLKLIATYGRTVFALFDASRLILSGAVSSTSNGEDSTVQVFETVTDFDAVHVYKFLTKINWVDKFAKMDRVDFGSKGIHDGDVTSFDWFLRQPELRGVNSLDLRDNLLSEGQTWAVVLKANKSLHSLNLESNRLGPAAIALIANAIESNFVLKRLLLSGNPVEDEGAIALGRALKSDGALEELGLSQCGIGVAGGKALAEGLKDNLTMVKLDLLRNCLCWEEIGVKLSRATLAIYVGDPRLTMLKSFGAGHELAALTTSGAHASHNAERRLIQKAKSSMPGSVRVWNKVWKKMVSVLNSDDRNYRMAFDEEQERLFQACASGNVQEVHKWLDAVEDLDGDGVGADVNGVADAVRAGNGTTPLMVACQSGHVHVVQILIQYGASVDAISNTESGPRTALHYAVERGDAKVAEALLDSCPRAALLLNSGPTLFMLAVEGAKDVLLKAYAKEVLLMCAAEGKVDFIAWLVESPEGGSPDRAIYVQARSMLLRLTPSVIDGSEAFDGVPMDGFLAQARLLAIDAANTWGENALMLACANGHLPVAKQLLKQLPNRRRLLSARTENGETALMFAAMRGQVACAEELLTASNVFDERGELAFSESAKNQIIEKQNDFGHSALSLAAKNGHVGMVQLLIRYKASTDPAPGLYSGFTPLIFACEAGHLDVARILKHSGASLEAKTYWNRTALDYAKEKAESRTSGLVRHGKRENVYQSIVELLS